MTRTKRTNKILSWLLCLAMVFTILPMSVFAAEPEVVKSYSVATLYDDGTLEIFDDLSRLATVPWQNERSLIKKVVFTVDTPLYTRLFSDCSNLVEITLPSTITEIPFGCFNNCTSLTSIAIPDSVTSIGERAFSECTSLKNITIPKNVTVIDVFAFNRCETLVSISIPDGVESISNGAFNQCYALTTVNIPDSVTSIGVGAFSNCRTLASITIPDSVTSIGEGAFNACSALTDINYNGTAESWNSITKGNNAIPSGVKINHTGSCAADSDHICDLCGKSVGTHADTDKDHDCDYGCTEAIGTHAAASGKHTCDYCGTAVTTCKNFAEVVKPEALKSAADCTNPAMYYKSCMVCGANSSETFTNGEANGHNYTYTASGNVITETCICEHSETATISAPENPVYDGTAKGATVTYTDNWQGGELTIAYSDGGNIDAKNVTASIEKGEATATVEYEIAKAKIDKPTPDLTTSIYNGMEQTFVVTPNDNYTVSGNTMTNAGSQDVTIAIKDKANFEWADGTTDDVTFTFTIAQATPIAIDGSVTKASSIRKNNKLSASTITGGKYKGVDDAELEGTYAWKEPDKDMTADSKEIVVFTPSNTNYASVEIEVDVDVTSSSSSGGGGVSRYTIKFDTDGGTAIANKTVTRNSKLAEPETPTKDGYSFIGWFTDEELTTAYDFDSKVTKGFTLYAKWEKHDDEEPVDEQPVTPEWENPFTDVKADDWYYEDVEYAVQNGLFNGTTESTFAPNGIITRAMMVTVLYRAEGEPATNRSIPFADVDMGAYYANAVIWAKQNNIVKGVSETEFVPDQNITREQIAAIMHRYAQYKGYDVSVGENTNILSYTDFDSISEYAIASMQYAVGSGLMKGKTETTLNPLDNATRAEIAAILHRFIEANK